MIWKFPRTARWNGKTISNETTRAQSSISYWRRFTFVFQFTVKFIAAHFNPHVDKSIRSLCNCYATTKLFLFFFPIRRATSQLARAIGNLLSRSKGIYLKTWTMIAIKLHINKLVCQCSSQQFYINFIFRSILIILSWITRTKNSQSIISRLEFDLRLFTARACNKFSSLDSLTICHLRVARTLIYFCVIKLEKTRLDFC